MLPLILAGGALLVSGATAAYEYFNPDVVNNNKIINQNDYISNETTFDFSESYFEDGSNISLSQYVNTETNKSAIQKDEKDNTLLYLGLVGVGLYLYMKNKKGGKK